MPGIRLWNRACMPGTALGESAVMELVWAKRHARLQPRSLAAAAAVVVAGQCGRSLCQPSLATQRSRPACELVERHVERSQAAAREQRHRPCREASRRTGPQRSACRCKRVAMSAAMQSPAASQRAEEARVVLTHPAGWLTEHPIAREGSCAPTRQIVERKADLDQPGSGCQTCRHRASEPVLQKGDRVRSR